MSDINYYIVLGRVVRNAETKTTDNGLFIANFSIATNRSKKNSDGSWSDIPHFFNFSLYGKRAESLAQYLVQGQQVLIEGHLIQRRWEKDGKKQSRLEIEIENIKLLGGKSKDNMIKTIPLEIDNSPTIDESEESHFNMEIF